MCSVSMIMDWGRERPREQWLQPYFIPNFEDLLRKAREYDKQNNEPDCELDEKRQALKKIAEELGVEIKFL